MKRLRTILYILFLIVSFILSAVITMNYYGSLLIRLLKVEWNDSIGKVYKSDSYNLYIPSNITGEEAKHLILFIHGGSFNSGTKEDIDAFAKYYTSKGYVSASVDYSLQTKTEEASLFKMNEEIQHAVYKINDQCEKLGIDIDSMATSGVSAGGTLAMNYALMNESIIPVKFVFQLSAPTNFYVDEWELLKRVDDIKSEEDFIKMMTGTTNKAVLKEISPSYLIDEDSVLMLFGYGLKDHCVDVNQKEYLIESLKKYDIKYNYLPFPNSNHGMYNDIDVLKQYL